MKRNVSCVSGLIALWLSVFAANAADLSGKWKGEMKNGNGEAMEVNLNLQVNGDKVTGTVANTYGEEQITEGMVKGDTISFVILAGGGQFKLVYKGKLEGDDLKFNVAVGDLGERELIAKRVK
jgi:hypothetical protein